MHRWGVVIDDESLALALQKLSEAGVIKLKSEARIRYDRATVGYEQRHQDMLDGFLKSFHLVHDPSDDRTYANRAEIFGAMNGREWNTDNLRWVVDYLSGRGVKLHWLDRPSQRTTRGHAHIPGESWAPKSDTTNPGPGLVSHASDPRFNGENDRKKMQRPGAAEPDLMASHNAVWMMQARALVGNTHSETKRIQAIVSSTPGGGHAAYQAGLAEQRRIENERSRGR